jgi:hypothetical protein
VIKYLLDISKKTYCIVPKQAVFLLANSLLCVPTIPFQLYVTKQIVDLFGKWETGQSIDNIMMLAILLGVVYFVNFVFFGSFNALALTKLYADVEVEEEFIVLKKTSRLPLLQASWYK